MTDHLAFWEDLRQDVADPDFAREYVEATALIQTLDRLASEDTELAPRSFGAPPATVTP